ncbi:MAG: DUF1499 domain-containing protein [Maritimibacter sp.]
MTLIKVALVLVVGFAGLQALFRLAPLPSARLNARPGPMEPGVHPMTGGVKIVRPLSELPDGAFSSLLKIAAQTPRTERLGLTESPAAFVTRSSFWGFPDITVIWVADDVLHLHSHLVFGKGDLGVNAARAARWFEQLESGATAGGS